MRFGGTGFLAMILALAHAGCGGDGVAKPTGAATPVSGRNLAPQEWAAVAGIEVGGRALTFEVSVDWTFRGNNVDVYVTPDDCVDIPSVLTALSCIVVAKAESQTARPERLTFLGEAGSAYKVFAVNRGTRPDTVMVTLNTR